MFYIFFKGKLNVIHEKAGVSLQPLLLGLSLLCQVCVCNRIFVALCKVEEARHPQGRPCTLYFFEDGVLPVEGRRI